MQGDPFAAPEVAERMAKTLKKAAKDAASTFGLGDATPRAGDAEKWAKTWLKNKYVNERYRQIEREFFLFH